jgi:hypothetical protein
VIVTVAASPMVVNSKVACRKLGLTPTGNSFEPTEL